MKKPKLVELNLMSSILGRPVARGGLLMEFSLTSLGNFQEYFFEWRSFLERLQTPGPQVF